MATKFDGLGLREMVAIVLILIALPVIFFLLKSLTATLLVIAAIGGLLGLGWLWGVFSE